MRSRFHRVSSRTATFAALLLAGCMPAPPAAYEDRLFEVPDSIPIKEYPQLPPAGAPTNAVRMVEDLVIGGDPADPETLLYRPVDVVASEDGTVYVADRGAYGIKVYGADGGYLKTLGVQGQGPGEFELPWELAIAGDLLVAYDYRNRRFSVWTLDGTHVADHAPDDSRDVSEMSGLADGTLIWTHSTYHPDTGMSRHLVRTTLEGEEISQLRSATGGMPREAGVDDPVELMQALLDGLEDERTLWSVGAQDVVYFSPARTYQVLALSPDGEPLWALRAAGPSPTVAEDRKQPLVDSFLQTGPFPGFDAAAAWEGHDLKADDLQWPATIPAIYYLLVDGAGRLFVFPPPEGLGVVLADAYDVHVFSPSGDYLASGTVPARWDFARGEYVYAMRTGIDQDPVVVRYRLTVEQ